MSLYEANEISFHFSCPYTSSQNGKAARKICSIKNIIRTLSAHALLPPSFWHHALQMATYLLNIISSKTLAYQSPLKFLYQKDPSYSHLRVFGCLYYPFFPFTTINKLQPHSTPCVFLGYPTKQTIEATNAMIYPEIKSSLVITYSLMKINSHS